MTYQSIFIRSESEHSRSASSRQHRKIIAAFLSTWFVVSSVASGADVFVSSYLGSGSVGTIGEYDAITGAPVNSSLITGLDSPQFITASDQYLFVSEHTREPSASSLLLEPLSTHR